MAKDNFPQALRLVLADEGGVSNHPADRGGLTNKGITQATYDAWRELHGRPSRSVRAIEHAEVDAIYREQFANKILFDSCRRGWITPCSILPSILACRARCGFCSVFSRCARMARWARARWRHWQKPI